MSATPRIAVVDYGAGNLVSIDQAFTSVGAAVTVVRDGEMLRDVDALVVPGVGAAAPAMARLEQRGLTEPITRWLASGRPFLGICLGLQLLFEASSENEGAWGLGLLQGRVDRLPAPGLKVPHIGWNEVRFRKRSALTADLPEACPFYFVHSFAPVVPSEDDVLGTAEYGEPFVCAVEREPLYGVQFHPEKSSVHGLKLLENFAGICAAVGAAH